LLFCFHNIYKWWIDWPYPCFKNRTYVSLLGYNPPKRVTASFWIHQERKSSASCIENAMVPCQKKKKVKDHLQLLKGRVNLFIIYTYYGNKITMLPHPISVINSYCTLYSTCKEQVILNALDLRAWCISVAPTELAVTLFGGLCSPDFANHRFNIIIRMHTKYHTEYRNYHIVIITEIPLTSR
jgi:hypothetical protein